MDILSKIQILEYSYWEHFKALKDISLILPLGHPRRIKIEASANEILSKLNKLKDTVSDNKPL